MSLLSTIPLLLLLPLVARAGFALSRLATRDVRLSRFLTPGVGLGLWLLAIHGFGLASHSFFVGLAAGTSLVAALGAVSFRWKLPAEAPEAYVPARTSKGLWLGAALTMALIAGPQLRWQEHDETCYAGHVAIPRQMENGFYPPRFTYFPQIEYRYHYGIDLATATFAELLHADPANVLHALSILLWGYAFCLWWLLGERWIGGAGAGAFAGFGVLLAGGLQFGCLDRQPFSLVLIGDCNQAGSWILPPVISNFLQHPWALATPLSLCALLIFCKRRRNGWWYGALFVLLTLLALAQIICFAALLGVICLTGSFEAGRLRPRRLLEMAALLAGVVFAVVHLHGLFTDAAEPQRDYLAFSALFKHYPLKEWMYWQLGSFGVTLPLGLLGLFLIRRERWLLALLALGGLVGANFLADSTVAHKFAMVAQLALAFLSAASLTWLWQRFWLRPLAVVALAASSAFAVGWIYAMAAAIPGVWFMRDRPPKPGPADQAAIAYLQRQIKPGENIFRSLHTDAYAYYGGLPEPFFDYQVNSAHFSQNFLVRRDDLMAHPRPQPEPYLRQAFRWFVLGPEDGKMLENLGRWRQSGRAELRAEFPPLQIFYLRW